MNFLVVGGGSIAKRHIRNLLNVPGVKIAVFTNNREVEDLFRVKVFKDLRQALADPLRAVVVANKTNEHLAIALAAADRGCHLFIEKPLSHTMVNVEKLRFLKEQNALTVAIGCNMRFHPALRTLKLAIENNKIGTILAVDAYCGNYLPDWRPNRDYRLTYSGKEEEGGGVILDLIHEIDYLWWFFGEVGTVAAFTDKRSSLEIDSEDMADILLQFRSGLVAHIHLDYVQRPAIRGCRIVGEKGRMIWDDKMGKVVYEATTGDEEILWSRPQQYDKNEMYVDEINHFLSCINSGGVPSVSLEEGAAVLKVALAAKQSSRNQQVVFL